MIPYLTNTNNRKYLNYSSINFGTSANIAKNICSTIEERTPNTAHLLPQGKDADKAISEILSVKNSNIYTYELPMIINPYIKNNSLGKYLLEKKYTIKNGENEFTKFAFNAMEISSMLKTGKEKEIKYLTSIVDKNGRPRFNGYDVTELSKVTTDDAKLKYAKDLSKELDDNGHYKYSSYQIAQKIKELA